MKLSRPAACLTLLVAGLAVGPGHHAGAAHSAAEVTSTTERTKQRDLTRELRRVADGRVTITRHPSTGRISFARAAVGGDLLPSSDGSPRQKADAYLQRYAPAFGADPAQLSPGVASDADPGTTVTYTQSYRGVPVLGGELRAHLDDDGDLTAVNGFAAPDLDLDVRPDVPAYEARRLAVAQVRADPVTPRPGRLQGLQAVSSEMLVYRLGSVRDVPGHNRLVHLVEVAADRTGAPVHEAVLVDARSGAVVHHWSLGHHALEREIVEVDGGAATTVFDEGLGHDPDPLLDYQRDVYDATGDIYWLFENTFDHDSFDGAGHVMRSETTDDDLSCSNAFFDGTSASFCKGVTSDDVVGHEWGHGYALHAYGFGAHPHSSALAESWADIWGETVDLVNGRQDEGEGDLSQARAPGACAAFGPAVVIRSPAPLAKTCAAARVPAGPSPTGDKVTGQVVLGVDDSPGSGENDGCSPFTNDVAGRVVLVDTGGCTHAAKLKNAQAQGAIAVLVADQDDDLPGGIGTSDPTVSIPGLVIRHTDRDLIAGALASEPVEVTLTTAVHEPTGSARWLIGEKSPGFGLTGIRDMWTPTCRGAPGKVTDAQYQCELGVTGHSNAGVPNHAYALTVDGGTFNGVELGEGIGLTRAAAVYHRAMTQYETELGGFRGHADGLTQACTDLLGEPLVELSTEPDERVTSELTIGPAHCAVVEAAAEAVELRERPTQCGYVNVLQPGRPTACDEPGTSAATVWREDFEKGIPGDWETDQEVVHPGANGEPWVATTHAPTGNGDPHPGSVAHGFAGSRGSCNGSADDFSTRDSLVTPTINLPGGQLKGPRLSWEHYVATENGFDGGNVKYRLDGGAWQAVPASAFLHNPPGTLVPAAEGNTNPMAGEQAFTGVDQGSLEGSWGLSQVDLAALGVSGGDELQLRFDVGRDGCTGHDGWYVDDVAVTICKAGSRTRARHLPEPSTFGRASRVTVEVRPATAAGTPSGTVRLEKRNGQLLARTRLKQGTAVFRLAKRLPIGRRTWVVEYAGSSLFRGSKDAVTVTVRRPG